MNRRALAFGFLLVVPATPAAAIDFSFDGYGDLRFVSPPGDGSYLYGDLGKLRFGYDNGRPNVHFTEAVGEVHAIILPELTATADVRVNPEYGPAVDLLEAWVRYRPISTSEWRWSVKAGAFFPPNSLENDEIGWTSFWTLTPSAINSWMGNELRIIGTEGSLQWRREGGTLTLLAAIYGWNDNAGEFMTDRGWNFDDRPTGLFEKERVPDETVILQHGTPPDSESLFKQIGSDPGWYVDLSWEPDEMGGVELMRYDNDANPAAKNSDGDVAWHTSFWDLGLNTQFGKITVLAQAMTGSTVIQPAPAFRLDTNFSSAYALAGIDLDDWWLAGRVEYFQTRTHAPGPPSPLSEEGNAETLSASWLPRKWLRVTGEALIVNSTRPERVLAGDPAFQSEKQLQLAARVYF
jgi:hypothetical protein